MIARVVKYLPLVVLMVLPAWSQESRGTLSGRVTDTSGAPIPDVEVQVTNVTIADANLNRLTRKC
jgi:hypothetical protein